MRRSNTNAWMLFLALAIQLSVTPTANAGKGNGKGGGNQDDPKPSTSLALQWDSYYFRSGAVGDCLGEDDELEWLAVGALQPGDSFSFTPKYPGCLHHPAAISVVATWDSGTLELTSTVPDSDLASWDMEQVGRQVTAPVISNRAQLCMFPAYTSSGTNYTVTLTNNSSEAVQGIELQGRHENDWSLLYYPRCLNADADGDGWNDSLEHSMADLLYPIGYIDGVLQPEILWGSNYLRKVPQSPFADDEIDSFPPDLDDDGMVTTTDLGILRSHLGEGNGVALSEISPNRYPEAYWFHANTVPFRRFDLNGDGWVDSGDVQIADAYLGLGLPADFDPVTPTARITSHTNGGAVPRGQSVRITAYAWDNAALAEVDYLVNGKTICSKTDPVPQLGFVSPMFSCWWDVPKQRAGLFEIEIRVVDAQGNIGWSEPVQVQSQ